MFFTCPNCGTVYDVPTDKAVLAPKFGCAKCGHVWKPAYSDPQEPYSVPDETAVFKENSFNKREQRTESSANPAENTAEDPLDTAANDFENPVFSVEDPDCENETPDLSAFKPIFKQPEDKPFYLKWLRPLYVAGVFCSIVAVYTLFFHEPRLPDLTIESLSPEFVEKNQTEELHLNAVLKNNTADSLIVGGFEIAFIDGEGRLIFRQKMDVSDLKIDSGETKSYSLRLGRRPAKALRIEAKVTKIIR